jgi:hypothetical protein
MPGGRGPLRPGVTAKPKPKPAPKPKRKVPPLAAFDPKTGLPISGQERLRRRAKEERRRTSPRRSALVIRRQQLLVSYGLLPASGVDGTWGPASQNAWSTYVYYRGKGMLQKLLRREGQPEIPRVDLVAEERRDARLLRQRQLRELRAQQTKLLKRTKALAKQKKEEIGNAAALELARESGKLLERGKQLRAKPAGAAKLDLHGLTRIISNPEFKFNPENRADTVMVQTWIRAKLDPKFVIDGEWGPATYTAFFGAYKKAEARQYRSAVTDATKKFYGKGGAGLVAGTRPEWWPLAGKVPEPGDLLKLLAAGDFSADVLMRAILTNSFLPSSTFFAERERLLTALLGRVHGPAKLPGFLYRDKGAQGIAWELLAHGSRTLSERDNITLNAQVNVLMNSRTADEFARRAKGAAARADAAYLNDMAMRAAFDSHFWEDVMHVATWPGEKIRDLVLKGAVASSDLVIYGESRHSERENERRAKEILRDMPVLARIAFELAVDPLIFLRPIRIGSTVVVAAGLGRQSLGAYKIAGSSRVGLGSIFAGGGRLVYEKATWHLPLKAQAGSALRSLPGVGAASQLKQVSIDKAIKSVELAGAHGFRLPKKVFDGLPPVKKFKMKAETLARIDREIAAFAKEINARQPALMNLLRDNNGSLYMDAHKSIDRLSNVGASLRGRVAEEIRITETDKLASSYATRAYHAAWSGGEESRSVLSGIYREEYNRVVRAAGLFIKGSSDASINDVISLRVAKRMQHFEQVTMKAIQDDLEVYFAAGGISLWDEGGRWAFRGSKDAEALRALARASFGKPVRVKNPMFGVVLTFEQYKNAVASEFRREQARIVAYHAREEMGGKVFDEDWVPRKLDEAREEIESGFQRLEDGTYVDIRQELEVSALYARGLLEAFGDEAVDVSKKDLASLATLPPPDKLGDVIDREIAQYVWDTGSAHFDDLADGNLGEFITRRAAQFRTTSAEEKFARGRIANAAAVAQLAMAQGTREALPYALRDNFALIVALSKAQSWPMRRLYQGVRGGMDAWIFATLPMRPGWMFRNIVDNLIKPLINGLRDPRYLFLGAAKPGSMLRSIFETDFRQVRYMIEFFDSMFGTSVVSYWDEMIDRFWMQSSGVLGRIFAAHGIPVSEKRLNSIQLNVFEQQGDFSKSLTADVNPNVLTSLEHARETKKYTSLALEKRPKAALSGAQRVQLQGIRVRDGLWELMGSRPENYGKRKIYRETWDKAKRAGLSDFDADEAAWAKVDELLFDYSKITTLEDNLRIVFPFIQYWRKNSTLWIATAGKAPWFPYQIAKLEQMRDEAHIDQPKWMRRYLSVDEITDATAMVPGLGWLAEKLPADGQYDPLKFFSFAPLYRVWQEARTKNPADVFSADFWRSTMTSDLPSEKPGVAFFGPFIDAVSDWGLGLSPFVRKPLEHAGIASQRNWQTVWPQSGLMAAFSRKFLNDEIADFIIDLDGLWGLGLGNVPSDELAENFDLYVNKVMVGFAVKGEPISRERAEGIVRTLFWEQNLWGYFSGMYFRRNTPEDMYLYQLHESIVSGEKEYSDLTDAQQRLEGLWSHRKLDRLAFDRYVDLLPIITAYYKQGSWLAGQRYLEKNPQIIRYVDPFYLSGRIFSDKYVANAAMILRGKAWFDVQDLIRKGDLSDEVYDAARSTLVTPELEAFWKKDNTPKKQRKLLVKGEIYRHLSDLNRSYHAIPETDHEARAGFLKEHPSLALSWQANNSVSDDYRALINAANAPLRERYFEIQGERGWAAANAFLRQHPFMFEWTKAASRVDEMTGEWIGGGSGSTAKSRAYLKAEKGIKHFFALMNSGKKQAAFDWLYSSKPNAKLAADFFERYGKSDDSVKGRAFNEARKGIKYFFWLMKHRSKRQAFEWLESDAEAAKLAKAYFHKYGKKDGSEHGRDFRDAKKAIKFYFDLEERDPDKAREWLHGSQPMAKKARAFFDKWGLEGGHSKLSVSYLRAQKWLAVYYDLPPERRQAWLDSDAREAKLVKSFLKLYGHERGLNKAAHAWLSVKPLLDRYGKMTKAQRRAFLDNGTKEADELLAYFKAYGHQARLERAFTKAQPEMYASRNAELAQRLRFWKQYFALTPAERPSFVYKHAESYGVFLFGAHGDSEVFERENDWVRRAMATKTSEGRLDEQEATFLYVKPLLDEYYQLPKGEQRDLFLRANPELREYFDVYTRESLTGNKQLDGLVEEYFKLPPGSFIRSAFLRKHPKVQDYFDKHSPPAERAMRAVLEVYFAIPVGPKRREFLLLHPEIGVYFDRKKLERDLRETQLQAFEQADPSLQPFFAGAEADIPAGAERMRRKAALARLRRRTPDALEVRRDRRPR